MPVTVIASTLRPIHSVQCLFAARRVAALAAFSVAAGLGACTKAADAPVVVSLPAVASVRINDPGQTIERGLHLSLTATVLSTTGATLPVPVTWRSQSEAVATVDAQTSTRRRRVPPGR
jgi:hypothetical protein